MSPASTVTFLSLTFHWPRLSNQGYSSHFKILKLITPIEPFFFFIPPKVPYSLVPGWGRGHLWSGAGRCGACHTHEWRCLQVSPAPTSSSSHSHFSLPSPDPRPQGTETSPQLVWLLCESLCLQLFFTPQLITLTSLKVLIIFKPLRLLWFFSQCL